MPNKIMLKPSIGDRYEEGRAAEILYPGHWLQLDGSNNLLKHNKQGGRSQRAIAIEDSLQGKTITGAYAVADIVRYQLCVNGDEVYCRLKAGENVDEGDPLISDGAGAVMKGSVSGGELANVVADSTAISNTTSETTFSNGTVTIPANSLKAGDVIRIRGQARAPSTNSTDTLNIKVKIGSTIIAASGALDVANDDICTFDIQLTIRTIGASGTFVASGFISIGASGTATAKQVILASTTLDTTAAASVTVTATWSAASASDQVVLSSLQVNKNPSGGPYDIIGFCREAVDNSAGVTETFVKLRVA